MLWAVERGPDSSRFLVLATFTLTCVWKTTDLVTPRILGVVMTIENPQKVESYLCPTGGCRQRKRQTNRDPYFPEMSFGL